MMLRIIIVLAIIFSPLGKIQKLAFAEDPKGVVFKFYEQPSIPRVRSWSRLPVFETLTPIIEKESSSIKWGGITPYNQRVGNGFVFEGKLRIAQPGAYTIQYRGNALISGTKLTMTFYDRRRKANVTKTIYNMPSARSLCAVRRGETPLTKQQCALKMRRGYLHQSAIYLNVGDYYFKAEGFTSRFAPKAKLELKIAPPTKGRARLRFYPLSEYSVWDLPEGVNGSEILYDHNSKGANGIISIKNGASGISKITSPTTNYVLKIPLNAKVSLISGASHDAQYCASCHNGLNPDPKIGKNYTEILYALQNHPGMAGVMTNIQNTLDQQNATQSVYDVIYEITAHNNRHLIEVINATEPPGEESSGPNSGGDPSIVVENPDGTINQITNAIYSNGDLSSGAKSILKIPENFISNVNSGAELNQKYCVSCHTPDLRRKLSYEEVVSIVRTGSMEYLPSSITQEEGSYEQAIASIVAYLWRANLGVAKDLDPDSGTGQPPTNNVDPIPDPVLSTNIYTGPFGFEQAAILCERFLFACNNNDIQRLVNLGLDGAINDITRSLDFSSANRVDYSDVASLRDLLCYGDYQADASTQPISVQSYNDVSRKSTDPLCLESHPYATDIYLVNTAWMNSFIRAQSNALRFRLRYMYFLHDERMSAGPGASVFKTRRYGNVNRLDHPEGLFKHHEMLWSSAMSMNYREYLGKTLTDYLVHGVFLDGYTNTLQSINENFAREFWELGSTGTNFHHNHSDQSLRNRSIYSQFDVAQSAKCLIGLGNSYSGVPKFYDAESYEVGVNSIFVPGKIVTGETLRIFGATPFEKLLTTGDTNNPCSNQLLEATLEHPASAEHLAFDIIKEYLHPRPSYEMVATIAKLITNNNYNLLPAFKYLMKSSAMYEEATRKELIKQPLELYATLLRTFPSMATARANNNVGKTVDEIPYMISDDMLFKMGQGDHISQIFFAPPSIFGYYPEQMMSAGGQLSYRRHIQDYLKGFFSQQPTANNQWEILAKSLNIIPTWDMSLLSDRMAAIEYYANELRLQLNDAQKALLAAELYVLSNQTPQVVDTSLNSPRNRSIDEGTLIGILMRMPDLLVK